MTAAMLLIALAGLQLETAELSNGLDVIVGEDHSSDVVTVCITVRTGATCETEATNGLAHFYEHMFFKGNAALPDQTAYNERMRELGIIRNGVTSTEMVRYYLTVTSDRFDEGMRFMYDAIASPLFDQEEIARERSVIMNEYQRNTASPWWDAWKAREQVIAAEPWRANTIGDPQVIQAASREVMRDFQNTYYTPDNSALIITGDIDPQAAFTAAEQVFSSWEYGGRSNYDQLERNISITRDTLAHVAGPDGIASISIVFEGPSMYDQREWTYSADVWGQYLSAMSGDFQENLVTNGPFTSVHAGYYTQRFQPTISFGGTLPPEMAETGYRLMTDEIAAMFGNSYFTAEGIELAVEQLRRSRLFKEESSTGMATETIPFWWVQGDGMEYYLRYPDSLAAVTVPDVEDFVREWVLDSPSASIIVTPEGEWPE